MYEFLVNISMVNNTFSVKGTYVLSRKNKIFVEHYIIIYV